MLCTVCLLIISLVLSFTFECFPSTVPPWCHSSLLQVCEWGPWAVCLRIEDMAVWGLFGGFLHISKHIDNWEPGKFPVSCSWDGIVCTAHGLLTILLVLMFTFERSLQAAPSWCHFTSLRVCKHCSLIVGGCMEFMAIWRLTEGLTRISECVDTGTLPVTYVWNDVVCVVVCRLVFLLIE